MKALALTVSVLRVEEIKTRALISVAIGGEQPVTDYTEFLYKITAEDRFGNHYSFNIHNSVKVGDKLEFVPRRLRDALFYDGPTITVDGKAYRMKN